MISKLQKREENIHNELNYLKKQKFDLILKERTFNEEERCVFASSNHRNPHGPWPIINAKYQVLSLLGKGGFSEVYKVYDLDNHRYAACKFHMMNPKWDKSSKENYLKHVIREITVFKNLNHPNIIEYAFFLNIILHL